MNQLFRTITLGTYRVTAKTHMKSNLEFEEAAIPGQFVYRTFWLGPGVMIRLIINCAARSS